VSKSFDAEQLSKQSIKIASKKVPHIVGVPIHAIKPKFPGRVAALSKIKNVYVVASKKTDQDSRQRNEADKQVLYASRPIAANILSASFVSQP
jgi:hypothetical protein